MGLDVPVYFSAGLTARANEYYKLFINWTNEKIKNSFSGNNPFDFKHIKAFDSSYASEQRAMYEYRRLISVGSCLLLLECYTQEPV
jgi:integrator complex subunit 11